MKWSPDLRFYTMRRWAISVVGSAAIFGAVCLGTFRARADLPAWMQSVVSGSAIESALYRMMELPGIRVLYPRPPAEARSELSKLLHVKPDEAEFYALCARTEEAALDFSSAEQDWKAYAEHAAEHIQDKSGAEFELADYYHRRAQGPQEIAALEAAATAPATTKEAFLPADKQRAWQAFTRSLKVAQDQALDEDATIAIYKVWITRYPAEPAVRASYIDALLKMRRFGEANTAIADYTSAFPQDQVFPVKAAAAVALQQGTSVAAAIALYDKGYQPLWPADLIQSYFQMLATTHTQRAMLAEAHARLVQNPDDLSAVTRIFYYYQQAGRLDAAANALAQYRASKESRKAAWTPDELFTFATLLDRTTLYEDAARYYFALWSAQGGLSATAQSPQEAALIGIIHILLTAPERPIDLGSGNLSIYRDVATVDRGPGYLNGILSLWLNSQNPAAEFQEEEQKATPYFHRAKAAELLAIFDQRFPDSASRPVLHAALIRTYSSYGADAAILKSGQNFLAEFPHASERVEVALAMADADARKNDTKAEFAVYDSLLAELAAKLKGMPLSAATATPEPTQASAENADGSATGEAPPATQAIPQQLSAPVLSPPTISVAAAYSQVLERYLGRLTASNQLPEALAVLRRELDRNPDDPLLYARLADFLQQNNFAAQQEEVYQRAIARFNDTVFYDKLARFYLREKRRQEFDALTRKVVDIFHGTELEHYFANVNRQWPEVYLQLNLYAHQRFPHDLTFTRNLLRAYETKGTKNPEAWEQLIREHWSESSDLQAQFFDYLSRTHKLDGELAELKKLIPSSTELQSNPAATRELAELHLWQSHFEEGAPLLGILAQVYPADASVGEEAASVFRSLAYYDPAQIAKAVEIEKHLSTAEPANLNRLARIGDIYADSVSAGLNLSDDRQLALASPYWKRMSTVHPGQPDGYLQSATVFWDYFQFDQAIEQIETARSRFHTPALYGYEAGAIYENKRDNSHAVAEYVRAATADGRAGDSLEQPSVSARARLLVLATRPEFAELVDKATASAAAQSPTLTTLNLRVDVLNTRRQKNDIEALVESAVAKTNNVDDAAQIADFSQRNHLTSAYRIALQREIALAADPVQRIELQYQLARACEDGGDLAAAQRIIETVYSGNPKILGVVRTTTDFYWKEKQPQRAIATLVQASKEANANLSRDFTLEAVAKSNQSGDFSGARTLLNPLLAADPYSEKYLALEADTYALAHDETGLRDFYASTLVSLKTARLSATEQRDKIALVRQGMIAALTHLKDYSGAVDQHIALISAFPEDSDILQNAALYARRYGREQQLVAFLNKAVADSPRDARFAIALGRVDALFEDDDGALAAYSKAIAIRKDRPDIYMARADIEERQQAFDAACADYERLYILTYKDPQWMEKVALARVRQGRSDLAVKALQRAWIDDRPPAATNYFRVADQLERWSLLNDARTFADRGVQMAGEELLTNAQNSEDALVYARILGRQRQAQEALALLMRLRGAADISPSSPAIVAQQVQEQGIAAVTDEQWRMQRAQQRQQQAQNTFRAALQKLSATVAEFYTPEEKLEYARLLDAQRANKPDQEVADVWIPAAQAADLKDREAVWRHDLLLHGGAQAAAQLSPFDALEAQRMDNAFRAETLEAYAAKLKLQDQVQPLSMAAQAWRDAGNHTVEARVLRTLVVTHQQPEYQERLFNILLKKDPQSLVKMASSTQGNYAEPAANYAVAHGSQQIAYQAVAAHVVTQSPLWGQATTALTGLYFGNNSPQTDAAFRNALADTSIGERLQSKDAEGKQLTGSPWFYYGMRYGVLLALSLKTDANDPEIYLPAGLEAAPRSASAYITLAQAYLDAKKSDAALTEYRHAVELAPGDPSLDAAMAEVLWSQGHREDAIAEWRQALAKLRAMVDVRAVPESFWTGFAAAAHDLREHRLGTQLRPEMDTVLRAYIKKNGSYRAVELLHAAYNALQGEDANAVIGWVLELAGNAADERSILSALIGEPWFPHAQLGQVYRRELELAKEAYSNAPQPMAGEENFSLITLTSVRAQYLNWLLQSGQTADAQRVFDDISPTQRQDPSLQKIAILLAVRQSRLPDLLASLNNDSAGGDSANGPSLQILYEVANQLRKDGDKKGSRTLLEYVFQQKLIMYSLAPSDYLALAEARLAANDIPGAIDLLHRLTMQPGDVYLNLDSAADLLVHTGHPADAIPLLTRMANGTPWNFGYRLRLGQAQLAAKQETAAAESFTMVAASNDAPYELRAQAAEALCSIPGTRSFGSAELVLLASSTPKAQQADRPYFVRSRIAAAKAAPAQQRPEMLRVAMGFAPASLLDRLRLQLFRAEMEAGHYEMAAVAVHPLLLQASPYANDGSNSSYSGSDENAAFGGEKNEIGLPLPAVLATSQEKLDFLLSLATMYEQTGEDYEAISALRTATRFNPDSMQRSEIAKRVAAANGRLLLLRENQMRRPVIHATLDQSVIVRPRLTSKTEPGKTEEVQP